MNLDKIKSSTQLKTAVLFLVFNRPDTTKEVFEKIRLAKPSRLYVAGDGPREGHKDDKKKDKLVFLLSGFRIRYTPEWVSLYHAAADFVAGVYRKYSTLCSI